jgi:hypothetical protein
MCLDYKKFTILHDMKKKKTKCHAKLCNRCSAKFCAALAVNFDRGRHYISATAADAATGIASSSLSFWVHLQLWVVSRFC